MATFLEATAVKEDDGRYAAAIDPDWFIWGPFGGYLAALALRGMGVHSIHRRPATFSCQYLNVGVAGAVEIEVKTVKTGRRAECLRVAILQAGQTLVEAQSWIVSDTLDGLSHDHARIPVVQAPSELPPYEWRDDEYESECPIWHHVRRRPVDRRENPDHKPDTPRTAAWACWHRLVEPLPDDDFVLQAARAVLWMDMAPWNAVVLAHEWPMTHIAPTLDLTVQFQSNLYAPDVTASDWLLVTVESPTAGAGLIGGHGAIWSETGKLAAIGATQCICRPNPRYAAQVENT